MESGWRWLLVGVCRHSVLGSAIFSTDCKNNRMDACSCRGSDITYQCSFRFFTWAWEGQGNILGLRSGPWSGVGQVCRCASASSLVALMTGAHAS